LEGRAGDLSAGCICTLSSLTLADVRFTEWGGGFVEGSERAAKLSFIDLPGGRQVEPRVGYATDGGHQAPLHTRTRLILVLSRVGGWGQGGTVRGSDQKTASWDLRHHQRCQILCSEPLSSSTSLSSLASETQCVTAPRGCFQVTHQDSQLHLPGSAVPCLESEAAFL
jgi:hypothetical protein